MGQERPGRRVGAPRVRGRRRVDGDRLLGRRRLLLGGRVPGRDGEPEHVGAGAGVALGEQPGELGDRRAQHRLGADHPPQRRQRAGVVGVGGAGRRRSRRASLPAKRTLTRAPGDRGRRSSTPARRSRRAGRGGPAGCRPERARPGRPRRAARPWRLASAGRRAPSPADPAGSRAGTHRGRPRRLFYQPPLTTPRGLNSTATGPWPPRTSTACRPWAVAVTFTEIRLPRSPGRTTYDVPVAPAIRCPSAYHWTCRFASRRRPATGGRREPAAHGGRAGDARRALRHRRAAAGVDADVVEVPALLGVVVVGVHRELRRHRVPGVPRQLQPAGEVAAAVAG